MSQKQLGQIEAQAWLGLGITKLRGAWLSLTKGRERNGGERGGQLGQAMANQDKKNPSWVVVQPSLRCSSVGMSTELQHPFFYYYIIVSPRSLVNIHAWKALMSQRGGILVVCACIKTLPDRHAFELFSCFFNSREILSMFYG